MFSFFKKKKIIAHLKLSGVIGNVGKFKQGIDFAGQEQLIKKAFSLKKATHVAISINSPGGSPVQSHLIYSFIRNQAKMLSMPLSSKDVFSIMAQARRDIQGIDKGEEPNVELDVPEECWLWEDLIAEGTLNLVVSMPKVGKSSLIGAFLGQLSSEFTEFLGKEIIGKKIT